MVGDRRRARGAEDGAGQEHVPRVQATASQRGRRGLRLRLAFPLPGSRGRVRRSNGEKQSLHHADQSRRGRSSPRDAARVDRTLTATRSQTIDGSTWDPCAERLLFTTENPSAPTYSATASTTRRRSRTSPGSLGRGGYEGIQNDSDGNIWIVEDIGGAIKAGHDGGEDPEQLHLPVRPTAPRAICDTGSCRCCRC